jgi:hypothetical protein
MLLRRRIPGRLLAVEVLLTLLLRQRTGVASEAIVESIETALIAEAKGESRPQQLTLFRVARAALEKISVEARRGPVAARQRVGTDTACLRQGSCRAALSRINITCS